MLLNENNQLQHDSRKPVASCFIPYLIFSGCFFSSHSEQPQPFKGLHAGGVDSHWYGWLLVCLHPEPLLQRSHEEDDERPGRLTEG